MLWGSTPQAGRIAKTVRSMCVTCKKLDKKLLCQLMGAIPGNQFSDPMVWRKRGNRPLRSFHLSIGRKQAQIWGIVIVDKLSGAVHCDVDGLQLTKSFQGLQAFCFSKRVTFSCHICPWQPVIWLLRPLEIWWESLGYQLLQMFADSGFKLKISPADSPWRQGK